MPATRAGGGDKGRDAVEGSSHFITNINSKLSTTSKAREENLWKLSGEKFMQK